MCSYGRNNLRLFKRRHQSLHVLSVEHSSKNKLKNVSADKPYVLFSSFTWKKVCHQLYECVSYVQLLSWNKKRQTLHIAMSFQMNREMSVSRFFFVGPDLSSYSQKRRPGFKAFDFPYISAKNVQHTSSSTRNHITRGTSSGLEKGSRKKFKAHVSSFFCLQ